MKLEDSSQFTLWAKWSINLFVQARILADVPLAFPQYPLLGPATLTADKEWWDRQAKSNTIKALREEQIFRPLPRVELKWDATETTLDEKTFKAKEKAAAKEYHESKAHFEKIYDLEFAKTLAFLKMETRRTVYEKLKDSLGLHFISATNVAAYGDAVGLLNEVHQFTPTDNEARKAHLISSFWDSSFQKEGTNDLAVWINYVTTAVHDLEQVGEVVSEASKTSRLLTALPIEIFREFKISRGVKPNKWTETVASLRVYAMIPEIAVQLTQLSTSRAHRPEGSVFAAIGGQRETCRNFQKGNCARTDCKYLHPGDGSQRFATCKHCNKEGHPSEKCWRKFPEQKPAPGKKSTFAPKNANVVLQVVQEAIDNGQTKVDLQALLKALKNDPARCFAFRALSPQQQDVPPQVQVVLPQAQDPSVQVLQDLEQEVHLQWAINFHLSNQ
jgi:hypothetical protein